MPTEATQDELLEIAAQLGIVGVGRSTGEHELRFRINEAGVSDEDIAAEVDEQRGRQTPGRPT